jgi:hypothetical protein
MWPERDNALLKTSRSAALFNGTTLQPTPKVPLPSRVEDSLAAKTDSPPERSGRTAGGAAMIRRPSFTDGLCRQLGAKAERDWHAALFSGA